MSANTDKIKEGSAEILITQKNVFYNPVQEFNRDLSIAVLNLYSEEKYQSSKCKEQVPDNLEVKVDESKPGVSCPNGIKVLEALSATGLRSIRYAKEVKYIKQIIANDISPKAVESIKQNISHNNVENLVTANHEDATILMYNSKKDRFDVIDLDPYGCPSIFLDSAVQSIENGGLLMITATDMAVLAGNSPETCYVKYGAVSLKSKACHEIALRILLQNVAASAGRYSRYIEPLLSISVDFYIRIFVRVYTGQAKCKNNTSKLGMIYQCTGCESMTIQPLGIKKAETKFKLPVGPYVNQLCDFCQHKHQMGGPVWIGPLHNQEFVAKLIESIGSLNLNTSNRMNGILNVVSEELDTPLYYVIDRITSLVKCHTPPMIKFRSALLNLGYKVSFSHANKLSIKTDAPVTTLWDVVRAWEKLNPAKREKLDPNSVALRILTKESNVDGISFNLHPSANPTSRKMHLTRFQVNPTAYWGPGTRSTMNTNPDDTMTKQKLNQNKNDKKRLANEVESKGIAGDNNDDAEPANKQSKF